MQNLKKRTLEGVKILILFLLTKLMMKSFLQLRKLHLRSQPFYSARL